jgi:imidazolonepropionase-like amidohydrolase
MTSEYGPTYTQFADGVDECRREARKEIRRGVDLLKLLVTGGISYGIEMEDTHFFTREEIEAFVEEAHRIGLPVATHATGPAGVKAAIESGVDTIEHGTVLDNNSIELLVETDTILVPTLTFLDRAAAVGDEFGLPPESMDTAQNVLEDQLESIREAYEAGVDIATGTDTAGATGMPHGDNGLEIELFVDEVGMSELDAIKSATSVAAKTLPSDSIDSIQPDYRADLLVLSENPLENIQAIYDITAVYKDGKKWDPA